MERPRPTRSSRSIASEPSASKTGNAIDLLGAREERTFDPAAPSIELPRGGGAIRGIGETFTANPTTGTGTLAIPISATPGRSGFGPRLTLAYDSGSGNAPFGFGWNLSIPSIARKTDKGLPRYRDAEESDVYVLSGAEDLVPKIEPSGERHEDKDSVPGFTIQRYRPRVEGLFARIERWTEGSTGTIHWRSMSRDNVTSVYGRTAESRIADPADPRRVFSWLLCESYDDKGNAIVYDYAGENDDAVDRTLVSERNRNRTANRYLKRVRYGNRVSRLVEPDLSLTEWLFELVFDYDEGHYEPVDPDSGRDHEHGRIRAAAAPARAWSVRPDPFSTHRAGFEIRTYRRCRRTLMFHRFDELGPDPCLVRATELHYDDLDGSEPASVEDELAHPGSTRFASFLRAVTHSGFLRDDEAAIVVRDGVRYVTYKKQSFPPLELHYSKAVITDEVRELDLESLENLPSGVDGAAYRFADLDGEGLSGILTAEGGAFRYKPNLGSGRFGPLATVASQPSLAELGGGGTQLLDLAGDGELDLVVLDGRSPGFYERPADEDWAPFRTFPSLPNRRWGDPNLRFVDLDGDGRADVLVTEDNVFSWHPSLGEEGFGPAERVAKAVNEEEGPTLVLADGTESIYLADMSGDGLSDLVRIRNGEICYWPNQGYGRFGPKVTMDDAPWFDHPDQFDQRRIRLGDVDGSGTSDVIFLGREGVRLYFNRSGNSWSGARALPAFPSTDDLSSVAAVDLLGSGTACLVWSTPLPAHGRSPIRYVDLMGGGKPHLLSKVVNNLGAETLIDYSTSTKFYLADRAAGVKWITKVPFPVHVVERIEARDLVSRTRFVTRYSYHHGFYDGVEREFRGFARVDQVDTEAFEDYVEGTVHFEGGQELAPELYQPPVTTRTWFHTGALLEGDSRLHPLQHEYFLGERQLEDPLFPEGLDAGELRECLRALKGLPLRQEVYSFDGTEVESNPYSVVENNHQVQLVQRRAGERHAVFLAVRNESLRFDYDRNPADPRVSHTLNLEIDEVGNVIRSSSVVYPRSAPDLSLPPQVAADQGRRYVVCTEADFTPDIDRDAPTPAYRLRAPFESRSYEITGIPPSTDRLTRSTLDGLIAASTPIAYEVVADGVTPQKRLITHGRTIFLDDALSPLPLGQWDTLALPHRSYRLAFTPGAVAGFYAGGVSEAALLDAGYQHFDGDANWWIPSATMIYPASPEAHFYIPVGTKDPFGLEAVATLDAYDLLLERVQVTQAAWNATHATNDYRVMGPVLITDPNRNRSAIEIDALGMVVKEAVMGKAGSSDGDTLADPTVRVEYELFNWMNHSRPNFARSFAREQHGAANPRWQESYTYSNGSSGVVLTKVQARPGKALQIQPEGTVTEVDADPRWIGNGRTVLSNKGRPVKQYEPYFSATHEYEDEKSVREMGVTPLLFYDAVGRNVRTLLPDGTFTRLELDPWKQTIHDVNDTVRESQWYADRASPDPASTQPLDSESRAAWLAARHHGTPGTIHFDVLGRPVYAVSDYGGGKTAAVRSERDLTGRFSRAFDQEDREIAHTVTGMLGTPMLSVSAEKGERRTFVNALDAVERTWDGGGREIRIEYDVLHRPVSHFAKEPGGPEVLFQHTVYGDRHPDAEARNLRGATHLLFDQAGEVRVPRNDFKGQPASVERLLARDYENPVDWSSIAAQVNYLNVQAAADPLLETGEVFTARSTQDALNRPMQVTLPDATVLEPTYDEANFLASLKARIRGQGDFVELLKEQDYDAKGQRLRARYGNNVLTRFFYDPRMFRLRNLLSYRAGEDPAVQALQDLHYVYDPIGNITEIRDDAQQTHFFDNAVVAPVSKFEYDAIYQLTRATGRERAGGANDVNRVESDLDFIPQLPHANDAGAVRTYTEEYEYDRLGNLKLLRHALNGTGWTRRYRYAFEDHPADRTNRLSATSLPGDPEGGPLSASYVHDAYGNMTRMPHLPELEWNALDQLREVDLGGGGRAFYVYGAGGERLRKVVHRNGLTGLEWIFLGAVVLFRRRRRDTGAVELERFTLHVSDDSGPFAQVDTKTKDVHNTDPQNPLGTPLFRYQFGNHLGSATLETDEDGRVLSYEEYHPFGTTAYRSSKPGVDLSLKRYRFSRKERDDETGLYYFGARYFAPWLGRWTSSDPLGLASGTNLFRYCRNNPIVLCDPTGLREKETYSISHYFTGNESLGDLRAFLWSHGRVMEDPGVNESNYRSRYTPGPDANGAGGTWRLNSRLVRDGESLESAYPAQEPESSESSSDAAAPPVRPLIQPGPPPTNPMPLNPVPKVDLPQAPPGTNFEAAASAGQQAARNANPGAYTQGVQAHHNLKWRVGQQTNLDPQITNDPRRITPLQSQTALVNDPNYPRTAPNGRSYSTPHSYADRGSYPYHEDVQRRRYGSMATDRVVHARAGAASQRVMTGSSGPRLPYIIGPTLTRTGGHFALAATRTFVPFVAEAELGLLGGGMLLYNAGYTSAGVAVFGAASYVPVVGGGLVAGAVVGNVAESIATDLGASQEVAETVGAGSAALGGAAVGALIGSVIPGVGTAAGAAVGAVAGLIGYGLSKWF
jgi:RHS repeat-associated protein